MNSLNLSNTKMSLSDFQESLQTYKMVMSNKHNNEELLVDMFKCIDNLPESQLLIVSSVDLSGFPASFSYNMTIYHQIRTSIKHLQRCKNYLDTTDYTFVCRGSKFHKKLVSILEDNKKNIYALFSLWICFLSIYEDTSYTILMEILLKYLQETAKNFDAIFLFNRVLTNNFSEKEIENILSMSTIWNMKIPCLYINKYDEHIISQNTLKDFPVWTLSDLFGYSAPMKLASISAKELRHYITHGVLVFSPYEEIIDNFLKQANDGDYLKQDMYTTKFIKN